MNEEEIKHRLYSDPDGFFDLLESRGASLAGIKKLDLPRLLVRERYKELIQQENFDAVDATFWISYLAEREMRDSILFVETALGKNREEIETELDEMTFGAKLKFIEENYNKEGKSDQYIKVLRAIKNLRNHMAHGRLDQLVYGKYSMSDPRGQMKLTIDIMNAALNRNNGDRRY